MSKKSAKNKKTKSKPSAKKSAKNRTWTAPTIIGLIVSVVGAVGAIELRPQMVIAPQQPTEKAEPYSVPFDIENSGYLSFYIEHVYCYVHEVTIGQTTINSNLLHYNDLDGITLGRGEGVSPLCYMVKAPIQNGNATIVIDYKPFRMFPLSFREYRSFKGDYIDTWQWVKYITPADVRKAADKRIENSEKSQPPAL